MACKLAIVNFLDEYRKHPCLWDKSDSDYKDRSKRISAEEDLLRVSGLASVVELRQKIRSLRCTYNQELAKIRASLRTSSKTANVYKPKLAWFEFADSFLRKNYVDNNKDTLTNKVLNVTENASTSHKDFDSSKAFPTLAISDENDTDVQSSTKMCNVTFKSKSKSPIPKNINKSNEQQKVNNSLENYFKLLQYAWSQKPTPNEFQIFGQHVAAQLEKLPLSESLMLQINIQNMLSQARLRTLNDIHFTFEDNSTSSSLSSTNIANSDNIFFE